MKMKKVRFISSYKPSLANLTQLIDCFSLNLTNIYTTCNSIAYRGGTVCDGVISAGAGGVLSV
jgi:hypothetical protein